MLNTQGSPVKGQLARRHPEKSLADDYVNSLVVDDREITEKGGAR